jgi:peptidoglycan/LPS O-acetylase OafA/YrhL
MVFAGHSRAFCFQTYPGVSLAGKIFFAPFYFVTGLGHQAVVVFFVLSGYLVGGSVLKELMETGRIHLGQYSVSRIVRIHSVLLPALLLGGLWDYLGTNWLHASAIYSHSHFPYVLFWDVGANLNAQTFLGNVACLHTIFVPVFGSNGPLWSLANEFWYYFLFPAALLTFWGGIPLAMRVIGLCATVFLLWLLGGSMLLGFLIWLAGVGVRVLPARLAPKWPLAGAIFLATLLFIKSPLPGRLGFTALGDDIVALGFCVWLLSITHYPPSAGKAFSILGKHCAGFSYTLYACHFPLLVFFAALVTTHMGANLPLSATSMETWAYYVSFIAAATVFCWGLSLVTEQQYHRLRYWLIHCLGWAKAEA